jgi:hypothetical protein
VLQPALQFSNRVADATAYATAYAVSEYAAAEKAEALLDSCCASLKHSMIRTCEHTCYNHHLTAQVLCTYAIVTFVMYVLAGALTLLQCGYAQ